MSAANEIAREAYNEFISKADAERRPYGKDELRKAVVEELLLAVDSGRIRPNNEQWAEGVFEAVDSRAYSSDQRLLRRIERGLITGEMVPLGTEVLEDLKTVQVSCGPEGRCTFGSLDLNLALLCDKDHYDNLKGAQDAYNDWRLGIFALFVPHWQKGMTAAQVIDQGLLFSED